MEGEEERMRKGGEKIGEAGGEDTGGEDGGERGEGGVGA